MLRLKREGRTRGVIVSGCLAERQKEQLLEERPDIDSLVGVFGREQITRVADRLMGNQHEQRTLFQPAPIRALPDRARLRITPRHFAYLKISEGCDRLCTFCAIPAMRGKHATKPLEEVVAEARELAENGVRELIVVAQDTTYYGIDLYGEPRLAQLLLELDEIAGIEWIRLMYLYPMYIDQRLVDTIAASRKILPYLDMPLQHIDDAILRRMSRRVTGEQTERLLQQLRTGIPELAMRTTLIAGFPGETEEQFERLVRFVQQQRFERLGVFTYSNEPGTPASLLSNQVAESVMEERRRRLMVVQQQIAFELNEARVGTRGEVILDSHLKGEDNVWIGRSYMDAPDVDSLVYVTGGDTDLAAGRIVPCEFVAAQQYDLAAVPLGRGR